jgi:alpha-tubulin suppressor-like RCC1 family protein
VSKGVHRAIRRVSWSRRCMYAVLAITANIVSTPLTQVPASADGPLAGAYGPGEVQSAYNFPTWSNSPNSLPNALYRHSALVANGYLFVIGGNNGSGPVPTVCSARISLDGSVGRWNCLSPPLPTPLQDQATLFANNHFYVIGGDNVIGSGTILPTSTVLSASVNQDGTTGAWSSVSPLPIPLYDHAAVAANGHLIVTGGTTAPSTPLGSILTAAIKSDGTLDPWVVNPNSLLTPLRLHSAVVSNNFIIITGGDDPSSTPSNGVYSAVLNPDGTVAPFTKQTNSLPVPLDGHRAVAYRGYIVVMGGFTSSPFGSVATVYYAPINPSNGRVGLADCLNNQPNCWGTSYNQLPQPLDEPGVVVTRGQLLLTGGLNTSLAQTSAYVYAAPFNVVSGTTTTGNPATVAVVMAFDDPNAEADLQYYRQYFHLPVCSSSNGCFRKVFQNLSTVSPAPSVIDAAEISEDLDMVSAGCPNCHILLVEANSEDPGDLGQSENTAANYGQTDSSFAPVAISNSWAVPEFSAETTAPHNSYFNHPGIAIVAAAGNGGYCPSTASCPNGQSHAGPLWPAVDPHVIAVGGTYLTRNNAWSEVPWNNNNPNTPGATSSGCSVYEAKPSWQVGVTDAACSMRMVPDVSAVSDGPYDLAHYDSYQAAGWIKGWGTSAATPVVAAAIALSGSSPNASYLYSHASFLHDVTTGNNINGYGDCGASASTTYYLCNAGPGYDGPTGLGTPNGTAAFAPNSFGAGAYCFITGMSGGGAHSVAAQSVATSWAWGLDFSGQLGNGTTAFAFPPVQVLGPGGTGNLAGVAVVGAGAEHTIALRSDGSFWAWGNNSGGQLGNGSNTNSSVPLQVMGLPRVVAAAAALNGYSSVALGDDGSVWDWGNNSSGQLGDGSYTNRTRPVEVLGSGGVGYLTGVVSIAAGEAHSLAVKSDGTVWAWGNNQNGQLGSGTTGNFSAVPVQVVGPSGIGNLTGVVAAAAGSLHSLALKSDGTLWAWGQGGNGALGNGGVADTSVPVEVSLTKIRSVAAGHAHSLALKSDGTVWAWGSDDYGQIGNGTHGVNVLTPVEVSNTDGSGNLAGIVTVAAGQSFSLATGSDGSAWGWGNNYNRELADGTSTDRWTPVSVTAMSVNGSCGASSQ